MAGFIDMAVTPNYGWPVPVATDYVKDGYQSIADLGDAIDATVFALPAPASGLTLINVTSFTAQSTVSVSNIFDSTYTNYRIMLYGLSSNGNQSIRFRCRENTTDKTSGYESGIYTVAASTANGPLGAGTADFLLTTNLGTADVSVANFDLYRTATKCAYTNLGWNSQAAAATFMGGQNINLTNFTGFTIYPSNTGTITGTVRVYGYQETI
jgi:hypothetical protein